MFREVTSPDGVSWRVEIDWMARRIRNPIRGSVRAARDKIADKRAARKQRRADKREQKEGSDWGDCIDCPGGADLDDLAILLLVIAFPQGIVGFIRERFGDDTADPAEKSAVPPAQRAAIKEGL